MKNFNEQTGELRVNDVLTTTFNEQIGEINFTNPTSSTTTSDKWKEYQDWLNEPPEISDEEIEAQAKLKYPYNILKDNDIKAMIISAQRGAWVDAIKWYREQLKSKK